MNLTCIDADSLMFRCAYGHVTNGQMEERWKTKLELIKTNTWADEIKVAIKGKDNFREKLDPMYKAQRPALEEDVKRKLNYLHHYAKSLGAHQCDGWEADDQVVSWAYDADKEGHQYVIAGIDKDLLQVPGNHYNYGGTAKKPMAEDDRWHFSSVTEGWLRFCKQLLTGDTIDNITGIRGIGDKKAEKVLIDKKHTVMMQTVADLYKTEFGDTWKDKLHTNCNLIYMRRFMNDIFQWEDHLDASWDK